MIHGSDISVIGLEGQRKRTEVIQPPKISTASALMPTSHSNLWFQSNDGGNKSFRNIVYK